MEKKKYSSYAQIDSELEILKTEKEISYQKLVLSIEKTKDSLTFLNVASNVVDVVKTSFFSSYSTILQFALPIIINWFRNKKRGN